MKNTTSIALFLFGLFSFFVVLAVVPGKPKALAKLETTIANVHTPNVVSLDDVIVTAEAPKKVAQASKNVTATKRVVSRPGAARVREAGRGTRFIGEPEIASKDAFRYDPFARGHVVRGMRMEQPAQFALRPVEKRTTETLTFEGQ